MISTKMEIPTQKRPLMRSCRFTSYPFRSWPSIKFAESQEDDTGKSNTRIAYLKGTCITRGVLMAIAPTGHASAQR